MNLVLSEEQTMLKQAARRLLQDHAPVSALRALRDEANSQGYSLTTWKQMIDNGWPAILVPESYGGLAFGHVGIGQISEMIGRNLSASPLFATGILGASAVARFGSAAQKTTYLPRIASGETTFAVALDEGGHHHPTKVATRAEKSSDGYTLIGQKRYVIDGHCAATLIVSARTAGRIDDDNGITLMLVDASQSGISATRMESVDGRNYATIEFDNVRATEILGGENEGADMLRALAIIANAHISAELLGVVEESFERTLQYLKDRKQFGVPIGTFQALQHRAAEMWVEIEQCKSIVLAALQALDAGEDVTERLVSMAKAKLCSVADLVTCEAIQLHGGVGMTDEYDIGFFIKRARALQVAFGGYHYHADRHATLAGY